MKNNKKRIFIFHPYPSFGGADRSIIKLINSLKNCEIFFISLKKSHYGKNIKRKIKYINLNSNKVSLNLFKLNKLISNIIKKKYFKKNILISNQNFANISSLLACRSIENLKIILIERNHINELKFYKNFYDFFKKNILLFLIKLLYRKSDKIIAISKTLSKDLSSYCNKKVITIYNAALNEKVFYNNNYKIKKKIINLKKRKTFLILNVALFEFQKDHFTLLKAYKKFCNFNPNSHLLLIGYGKEEGRIKEFIINNNLSKNISIINNVKNPQKYYKICDLFVLTSLYEGFANVIVESLKNNCPVITSDCKSGPLEIIGYGNYGDYFNVGNFIQLEKKIRKHYLNNKILNSKCRKSKKYLNNFNFSQYSYKFNKIINNI